jgi:branched-chain amino acid transport system permease protein
LSEFIGLTIAGLALGAIYAIAASGIVVTYTTSGVFNFAQGAIGMFVAFVYWQLRIDLHWAGPAAVAMTLLAVAPAIGLLLQWGLVRRLNVNDRGLTLVVTVAVMVAFMGLAFALWPQDVGHSIPLLFGPDHHVSVGGNLISYEELLSIALAAITAVGLRLLFFNTRVGTAMRGVVDDRDLIGLNGGNPQALSALSWMIGASLGGLAGILTASTFSLDVITLTLLVLNSFAAAMLGRLRNLPLTFVGAMIIGLADAYVTGYLRLSGWLAHLRPVLPTLFLFVVLLVLPSVRLRAGVAPVSKAVRVPSAMGSVRNGVVLVAAAMVAAAVLHGPSLADATSGVALGIGALSIVLLSGYGGQISLAQYAFFGLGAFVFANVGHGGPIGLLVAVGIGAAVGVLVALPALRLRGLELALSTLAFGQLAYYMFFLQPQVMGHADLTVPRLHLPGLNLDSDATFLVFLTAVFALLAAGVLAIRRGRFGQLIIATKDSQAACASLGLNPRLAKLALFATATAMATFGGALYGSAQRIVNGDQFQYVGSLFILLIVYIWGVATPGAALAGGLSLAMAPLLAVHLPTRLQALTYFLTGFGALLLVSHPEGIIPAVTAWVRGRWRVPAPARPAASPSPALSRHSTAEAA